MKNNKDIIGLVIHEEFTKAKKAIETSLDNKLAGQLNEFAGLIAGLGRAAMAAAPTIGKQAAIAGGTQLAVNAANKINGPQQSGQPVMQEDGDCQGEDCMHEDDSEEEKDEDEDEGDEDEEETDEDEDEGEGDEDEEETDEDEGDEDEEETDEEVPQEQDSAGDSSMKKRQGIIAFRAAQKSNDKKEMNEAKTLKGKQKNLDVAPPYGKLTSDDFKELRAKKGN